jgi:hypothetical protein
MFLYMTVFMSGRTALRDRVPSVEDGALAQLSGKPTRMVD